MHLFLIEHVQRLIEVIDRRNHLVTRIAKGSFIIEGSQRLVLDDEDALDDPPRLPEQHLTPKQ